MPVRNFASPIEAGRFGQFGQNGFRRDWNQASSFLSGGYVGLPNAYPPGGGESSAGPNVWAPVNVTLVIAARGAADQYPQAATTGGGPKIITIGPPSRSARFRKMPIVIYGTQGVQAN
jgi:hypothetical protein